MKLPKQAKTIIRVHFPFVMQDEIGLGDVVKSLTSKVVKKPCDGCQKRAAALNRLIVFTGQRKR